MSHPCPICGRDTNTLVCIICKLDPLMKDKVIEIRANAEKKKRSPGLLPAEPQSTSRDKGGKDMAEKKIKGHHASCEVEGCKKYIVKDKRCYSHYKEKHGIAPFSGSEQKKKKRKYTKRPFDTDKMLANHPSPEPIAVKPAGLRGIRENVLDSMQIIKSEITKIEAII